MVVTRVGQLACALPISHVVETMRPLPVQPVLDVVTLPYLRGLAIVRGAAVPVIDVARLLGQVPGDQRRFVVVRTDSDQRIALLVDAVLEVKDFERETLGQLPRLLQSAPHDVVTAIGTLDAGLMVVLDAARVVPEATWAMLVEAGR